MKIKRDRRGRFIKDLTLYKFFIVGVGVCAMFVLVYVGISNFFVWSVNTINSFGDSFEIHNAKAEAPYFPTWQEEVIELLREYGIDTKIASAVITCESGWNPKAYNKNRDGSVDRGIWQINSVHQVPASELNDPVKATYHAIVLIKSKRSWNHWYAYGNACFQREIKKQYEPK